MILRRLLVVVLMVALVATAIPASAGQPESDTATYSRWDVIWSWVLNFFRVDIGSGDSALTSPPSGTEQDGGSAADPNGLPILGPETQSQSGSGQDGGSAADPDG